MHISLIGGGWDPAAAPVVYGPFLRRAAGGSEVAAAPPRIAIVLLDEGDGVAADAARYVAALSAVAPIEPRIVPVPIGGALAIEALAAADGLLVGGGLTPGYAAALAPVRAELSAWLRERDRPYAGFSAGAAIAAEHAVVGGWRHRGRPVCPEDAGEDLDEVTVVPGLGLVPWSVEVHADAWSTAPRLAAALGMLGPGHAGYAIDEGTALIVDGAAPRVVGAGGARLIEAPA